jgi:hypothetical protein
MVLGSGAMCLGRIVMMLGGFKVCIFWHIHSPCTRTRATCLHFNINPNGLCSVVGKRQRFSFNRSLTKLMIAGTSCGRNSFISGRAAYTESHSHYNNVGRITVAYGGTY